MVRGVPGRIGRRRAGTFNRTIPHRTKDQQDERDERRGGKGRGTRRTDPVRDVHEQLGLVRTAGVGPGGAEGGDADEACRKRGG